MIRRRDVIITKAADADPGTYYVMCEHPDYYFRHKTSGKDEFQVVLQTTHSLGDIMKQLQRSYKIVGDDES